MQCVRPAVACDFYLCSITLIYVQPEIGCLNREFHVYGLLSLSLLSSQQFVATLGQSFLQVSLRGMYGDSYVYGIGTCTHNDVARPGVARHYYSA